MDAEKIAYKILKNQGLTPKELDYVNNYRNQDDLERKISIVRETMGYYSYRWHGRSPELILAEVRQDKPDPFQVKLADIAQKMMQSQVLTVEEKEFFLENQNALSETLYEEGIPYDSSLYETYKNQEAGKMTCHCGRTVLFDEWDMDYDMCLYCAADLHDAMNEDYD